MWAKRYRGGSKGLRRTDAPTKRAGTAARPGVGREVPGSGAIPGLSKNCTKPAEVRVPAWELTEACLAHAVGNATVHAYQRSSCWRGADF